jgi:methionyl-tRNA formyltransferase
VAALSPLRVVFGGTPAFAARALEAILKSRHRVAGVLTQPDRPAGRGQKLLPSPVKQLAQAAGLPLLQPISLRDPDAQHAVGALRPDVIVVAAYGLILPRAVLDLPPCGCLNIHASLLPRWRGAAPIVRAIQAGDRETGICIMKMEAGLDTGPVAIVRTVPIQAGDTAGSLHDRLADVGAEAIIEALDAVDASREPPAEAPGRPVACRGLTFVPQPAAGITYASKVDKREVRIDWRRDAISLANHLRAFDPQPGAQSALARQPDVMLRLFGPTVERHPAGDAGEIGRAPGEVLSVTRHGIRVATGDGILQVSELQRPGGRRLPVEDFIRGHPVTAGDVLLSA